MFCHSNHFGFARENQRNQDVQVSEISKCPRKRELTLNDGEMRASTKRNVLKKWSSQIFVTQEY